ncbi:MAG: lipid A phosphoethanolamine transferase [Rikenellaceae bacterium]|nr:lipid A phosphoethanolamine transferase [Rikenellaceae bacterium]
MGIKKLWEDFLDSPAKIFVCFIAVNLIPSVGLLFTEPLNGWGKILLILFPAAVYLMLYSGLKNIGLTQLLLIPLLIIHAFQMVVFYLFGEEVIAVDMFLNVLTTNASEAGELLGGLLAAIGLVVLIYVPTIVVSMAAYRRRVRLSPAFRRHSFLCGAALLLICFMLRIPAKNRNTDRYAFHEDAYPANVCYNLYFARQKWLKTRKYPETSRDFTFGAFHSEPAAQREIYVLVIGETSRPENWSLYGYSRNTTPHLQQDSNLVVIRDALTQSNTTHKSVSIMLTTASAENYEVIYSRKSILTAFREAGFRTIFLSNQSANRSFTDYFSQQADECTYFRFSNELTNHHDEVLLTELEETIRRSEENLFVVLHTYGSHFKYTERYPEEFSVYRPDQVNQVSRAHRETLVNAYDNSILYTDHLLYRLTELLLRTEACSAFLYASDHGEDILDDDHQRFLHASPNPSYYQLRIPMLLWFSPVYGNQFPQAVDQARKNKDKPVSTSAVFHTLLDLARIETEYKNPARSRVGERLETAERLYLTDHDKPIPFHRAGLKTEDLRMLEKRNIAF